MKCHHDNSLLEILPWDLEISLRVRELHNQCLGRSEGRRGEGNKNGFETAGKAWDRRGGGRYRRGGLPAIAPANPMGSRGEASVMPFEWIDEEYDIGWGRHKIKWSVL